jgi:hypothetical protein
MMPEDNTPTPKQRVLIWLDTWLVVTVCLLSWVVLLVTHNGNGWAGLSVGVLTMVAALNADKVSLGMAVAMLWVFRLMQAAGWRKLEAGPEKFAWMVGAVVAGAAVVGVVGWVWNWWRRRNEPKDW